MHARTCAELRGRVVQSSAAVLASSEAAAGRQVQQEQHGPSVASLFSRTKQPIGLCVVQWASLFTDLLSLTTKPQFKW